MNGVVENPSPQVPTRDISRPQWMPYLLFTFCATIYLLPFMRLLLEGTDEGTLISGAARIVHGQVFARDFFEAVGPGTFYWLAMFFKLFGVTFLATRICLFITSLGTAFLLYFLSRRVCARYQALPCVLVFSTYFGAMWPTISHHVDSNFFALLSVASLVLWRGGRKDIFLVTAGAFAGATTCLLQPKGLLLLISQLLWLAIQRRRRSASLAELGLVLASYCSMVGLMLAYFWSRGALWDLVYANFVFPSNHYGAVNAVPYAQGIFRAYLNHWIAPSAGTQLLFRAMAAVLMVPFLLVAGLPVLLLISGALYKWSAAKPEFLLYCLCGLALWLSEFHRKDIFHLVFGSPLLMIVCIYLLLEHGNRNANLALQILSISAGSLACFNFFLVLAAHPIMTRVGSVAMFKDDPVLTFLEGHVTAGEKIFAYPYSPMYYFLSATRNATAYSILIYNYNSSSQFHDVIETLEQQKVRYVLWDTNFLSITVPAIFPTPRESIPADLILEPYLESHYKVVMSDGGVRIMERKTDSLPRFEEASPPTKRPRCVISTTSAIC